MVDHGQKVAVRGTMWQKVELAPSPALAGGWAVTSGGVSVGRSGELSLSRHRAWVELAAGVTPWQGQGV